MDDKLQKEIFRRNLLHYLGNTPQAEVAKALNVSPQTFNTWCQGKALPRMGKVQSLADYFGVLKSDLIEDASAKNEMNEDTDSFTSIFQRLSPSHQKAILEYINFLSAQERHDDDQK